MFPAARSLSNWLSSAVIQRAVCQKQELGSHVAPQEQLKMGLSGAVTCNLQQRTIHADFKDSLYPN